jgi:hypothetical protein
MPAITFSQQLKLRPFMRTQGANFGRVLADRVFEEFPDGFTDQVSAKVTQILLRALDAECERLAVIGHDNRAIEIYRAAALAAYGDQIKQYVAKFSAGGD